MRFPMDTGSDFRAPIGPGPGALKAGSGVQDLVIRQPRADDLQAHR